MPGTKSYPFDRCSSSWALIRIHLVRAYKKLEHQNITHLYKGRGYFVKNNNGQEEEGDIQAQKN